MQQFNIDFISGLVAGVSCAAAFNPWDKALYLSLKNRRDFLNKANFLHPYQGAATAISQRAFLGSIYYIAQGELNYNLSPYLHERFALNQLPSQCLVGFLSGAINGLLNNSVSAIKYHTWGQEERAFFRSMREMKAQGGLRPFVKGTIATIGRETVFGASYEVIRFLLRKHDDSSSKGSFGIFAADTCAAGISTIASSPLNYARSLQYATAPEHPVPTIRAILSTLWHESKATNQRPLERLSFFQQRLRIGWGTARVAVGMAMGQKIFDSTRCALGPK